MDAKSKAVMMAWERPLMKAHVRAVCQGGGKVLNVGFGMGFVDEAMHRYEPEEHTVVEAHPEVYERMLKLGWGEKKNIRIVFGRWQDMMPQLGSYEVYVFSCSLGKPIFPCQRVTARLDLQMRGTSSTMPLTVKQVVDAQQSGTSEKGAPFVVDGVKMLK